MNLKHWLTMGAIAITPCASALAQDTQAAPQTTSSGSSYTSDEASQWLASGFVGSNFANNAQPASMNFGGSLGYFWKNMVAAEFDTSDDGKFERHAIRR